DEHAAVPDGHQLRQAGARLVLEQLNRIRPGWVRFPTAVPRAGNHRPGRLAEPPPVARTGVAEPGPDGLGPPSRADFNARACQCPPIHGSITAQACQDVTSIRALTRPRS